MKTLLCVGLLASLALGAFGQGTVIFNNRITGTLVTYVYLGGSTQLRGNGSADTPAGTTDWRGLTKLSGSGYSAQLLAAPGAGVAEDLLVPALPVTTFRTGAAAGNVAGTTATLANVPADAAVATLMMVAWDNQGGRYPDWTSAKAAWQAGLTLAATSGTFNVNAIGGAINPAPALTGLTSFNMFWIPEPSTISLVALGAAAALMFRRR